MIFIKNSQKQIPINLKQVRKWGQIIMAELGYEDFDLNIWFCGARTIAQYNEQFRNKKEATDVLSFPFYPDLKAGERIQAIEPENKQLGDLIIAPIIIKRDAASHQVDPQERLKLIIVHGILHLIGYDHITDADYKIMHRQEVKLLKLL